MWSAMATGRNCIGYEIETNFRDEILPKKDDIIQLSNNRIRTRIQDHLRFVEQRSEDKDKLKYINRKYQFPVMTRQEIELFINPLESVKQIDTNTMEVAYADTPDLEFNGDRQQLVPVTAKKSESGQLQLF